MKRITINNKEYSIEFTIEASLYDECTKSIMDTFIGIAEGSDNLNRTEYALKSLVETISNLPQKTLTVFYAGLLEHHGPEGDGSIKSKNDAKKVLADYLRENKKSYRDVMTELMEIMADDSFFDLIGLTQITKEIDEDLSEPKAGKSSSEKK